MNFITSILLPAHVVDATSTAPADQLPVSNRAALSLDALHQRLKYPLADRTLRIWQRLIAIRGRLHVCS